MHIVELKNLSRLGGGKPISMGEGGLVGRDQWGCVFKMGSKTNFKSEKYYMRAEN